MCNSGFLKSITSNYKNNFKCNIPKSINFIYLKKIIVMLIILHALDWVIYKSELQC